jgi:serine phosphatase RsbU (regulator of sigma subunit)/anti-sigma regulatory factor (Ser/Thr protein kinase)/DNA-binding response OmpR family regulator
MTAPVPQTPEEGAAALRLVVIEDNRDYAWLVEEMLNDGFGRGNITVSTFESLADARAGLEGADCALVDLSLPDGSGLEVVATVQEAAPALPLVVLTGAEDEELALRAVELGAQDYLVKRRVDPEVLHRSIRYAIERKRSEGQRAELLHARAAQAEAEALSSTLARLQDVADAAITAHGARLDPGALLERSLAVVAADAGALLVRDARTGELSVAASSGIPGLTTGSVLDAECPEAATDGALVLDEVSDNNLGPFSAEAGVASLVAVPLEADGRHLGSLVAVSRVPARFSADQARLLALAADRCARALANATAHERERKAAAALQAGLLPQAVPALRHGEIAVRYLPARDGPPVGGDWYDAVVLGDGRLALAIGDVTGHGAEAAVLMGQLRTALRAYALEGSEPALVVERLNALALSLGEPAIATLVYLVLDASLESGQYVIAGHPRPIVVSARGAEPLAGTSSLPAGVESDAVYEQHDLRLAPGDALCLYSDGLVEERGVDPVERERDLVTALGTSTGAEVLCERALMALRPEGPADDDVALLILRTGTSAHALKAAFPATPEELSTARRALGEWLRGVGVNPTELSEITLACNEACMNVVEHAYNGDSGQFAIEGYLDGETVVIIVRDLGRWTEVQARGRGRGLKLMEALMDSVQLSFSAQGTVVVMRRTLGGEGD